MIDMANRKRKPIKNVEVHECKMPEIPRSTHAFRAIRAFVFGFLAGIEFLKIPPSAWKSFLHVHTRFNLLGLKLVLGVSRRRVPIIYTVHNPDLSAYAEGKLAFAHGVYAGVIEIMAIRMASLVIALTERDSRTIRMVMRNSDRILTIPVGVNIPELETGLEERMSGRTIICPARVTPRKNQLGVIKVATSLRDENCSFTFTGPITDKGYLQLIKEYVHDHDLGSYVRFLGDIPRTRLEKLFLNCFLVILLSREEVQPSSILEAASYHIPVIAADIRPIREMVNGHGGIMLNNPDDTEVIADEIRMLLGDREYYEKMSNEVFSLALEHSWERVALRMITQLDDSVRRLRCQI